MNQTFIDRFMHKLLSGTQIFWIQIHGDEKLAEDILSTDIVDEAKRQSRVLRDTEFETQFWDGDTGASWSTTVKTATDALKSIETADSGLYVFRDLGPLLAAPTNDRLRRVVQEMCKKSLFSYNNIKDKEIRYRPIIILDYEPAPPLAIRDYCDILELPFPDYAYLRNNTMQCLGSELLAKFPEELADQTAKSLLGLSNSRAQSVLASSLHELSTLSPELPKIIADEKCASINSIEGLTYVPHRHIAETQSLGGYDNLLNYIQECKAAMSQEGRRLKIDKPRGIALIGPPGTGKTTAGELIAKELGTDLVKLDPSCFYSKYLGDSQRNARIAIQTINSLRRCAVLVDEIEKILGHAHETQSLDAGVSSQVLSMFLKWLAERDVRPDSDEAIFVIVTMNRHQGIPPEMLRAGRFDQIFFSDLPGAEGRKAILDIHLRKRGIDPTRYGASLDTLARDTTDFSGAELEELLVRARRKAFYRLMSTVPDIANAKEEDAYPSVDDLVCCRKEIRPTASRDPHSAEIRKFGLENCTPVGLVETGARAVHRNVSLKAGNGHVQHNN